jgi:predicted Zn-dependent protease
VRPKSPQELVERALAMSRADGCVVIAEETSSVNLRWATNTLTTNGVARGRSLTVIATVAGTEGTAAGVVGRSDVGLDEVERLVRQAEQAARDAGPAEDAHPLVDATAPSPDWDDPAAETSAAAFARFAPELGETFAAARADGRALFGFAEHDLATAYLASSTGLRLRHTQPSGRVELTGKSADWSRSTWTGYSTRDFADVDVAGMDAEVRRRLAWSQRRMDLPAGRYDTILPPSALADLLVYLYWSAAARDAHDGRTVFSRPGGGTRAGERLTQRPVTLRSDPDYPGLECAPFVLARASSSESSVFDNGLALASTEWVREGTLAALLQTRHSARLTGLSLTPPIDNLVLEQEAATAGLDELVGRLERGLLLTCLWYIREVDPQTLLLTGLTRDGVYLVEGGEVVGAVNNFRWNESPVDLLGRFADVGATTVTLPREWADWFTRTAMPPVRVDGFNMSSVSPAS